MKIDVANEFYTYPAGRFPEDGAHNGERFREEYLVPRIKQILESGSSEELTIDIDGVRSFGSSFLEESFAGLIRYGIFPKDVVRRIIRIRCTKPHLFFFRDMIVALIDEARVEVHTQLAS
ncbi:STAS-like domain-containing protein [Mesorhizobium sp. M0621]|uniref:STAS-like domain-containing protein n=1 Tax=Mesorhizobium sp. M0621 TaxID=2956974 RepID=UPI0033388C4F